MHHHLSGKSGPKIILIRGIGHCVTPITILYLILEQSYLKDLLFILSL
jgi:hypothetical protein